MYRLTNTTTRSVKNKRISRQSSTFACACFAACVAETTPCAVVTVNTAAVARVAAIRRREEAQTLISAFRKSRC